MYAINGATNLRFNESYNADGYDGFEITGARVKVVTDFGVPLYKSITVVDGCPSD
jgi:hypothetical protein